MKLKNSLSHSFDLIIALSFGFITILLVLVDGPELLRWFFGFSFVFFGSGYSITRLLPYNSSLTERIIVAASTSLLLTYPASVLTVILEGQDSQAIFGNHLLTSLTSLIFLSLILNLFVIKQKTKKPKFNSFPILLLFPLVIFAILTLYNLNRADVFGDEYDLGYQAYNLVDGIIAGRKAFIISMSQHPPLAIDIKHFSMNILQPHGLDDLADWQFRFSEGLVGLLVIVTGFALAREVFSERIGILTAFLLSVNNYMVWMGRTVHREMYLTFFMATSVLFYIKARRSNTHIYQTLSGLSFGASLLVKETALLLMVLPLADTLLTSTKKQIAKKFLLLGLLVFSPVIIFNIAAHLTTGYSDVFFSNIFGSPHPLTTPREHTFSVNIFSLASYLIDIYSPLISIAIAISLLVFLQRLRKMSVEEKLVLLWIGASILFFSFTAVRAYYFLFLTVPFMLILAKTITKLPTAARLIGLISLLLYSLYYSFNTNIDRSYTRANDVGGVDGSIIVNHPLDLHYSIAARSWVEEVGYKKLQQVLDNIITKKDCLITSESFNELAARRYLGQKDGIKKHYLGDQYPSRYQHCPRNTEAVIGIIYLISDTENKAGILEMVISDHLDNNRFYLFRLEKGGYS